MRTLLRRIAIFLIALSIAAALSIVGWAQWMMLSTEAEIRISASEVAPADAGIEPNDAVERGIRDRFPGVAGGLAPPPVQPLDRNSQSPPTKVVTPDARSEAAADAEPSWLAKFPDRHRKLDARTTQASRGERGLAAPVDLRIRPREGSDEQLLGAIEPGPTERVAPRASPQEASPSEGPALEASSKPSSTVEASTKKTKERVTSLARDAHWARARERAEPANERSRLAGKRRNADQARASSNPRSEAMRRDPLRHFFRSIGAML